MSLAEALLPEFDHEMQGVRRLLELTPDDKLGWRAGESLNTIGWVANHLAEIPGWVGGTIQADSWDIASEAGQSAPTPTPDSASAIVELFDQNVVAARETLAATDDATFAQPWSLVEGDKTLMTMPKCAVIRTWVLNHAIHHRAHLSVYLRLCGVEVPQMYGAGG